MPRVIEGYVDPSGRSEGNAMSTDSRAPRTHGPDDGCGELLWEHMESDPSFNKDLRQAEADLAEGRGVPFRLAEAAARVIDLGTGAMPEDVETFKKWWAESAADPVAGEDIEAIRKALKIGYWLNFNRTGVLGDD